MAKKEPNIPVMITCTACSGNGEIELPQVYKETLDAVPRGVYATTSSIRDGFKDVSPSSMSNRLTWLMRHGLVDGRTSTGREREWRRL